MTYASQIPYMKPSAKKCHYLANFKIFAQITHFENQITPRKNTIFWSGFFSYGCVEFKNLLYQYQSQLVSEGARHLSAFVRKRGFSYFLKENTHFLTKAERWRAPSDTS